MNPGDQIATTKTILTPMVLTQFKAEDTPLFTGAFGMCLTGLQ